MDGMQKNQQNKKLKRTSSSEKRFISTWNSGNLLCNVRNKEN